MNTIVYSGTGDTRGVPVDGALEHRLAAIPEFGNRVLRVIVNGKVNPPRIVTACFDRRGTRE